MKSRTINFLLCKQSMKSSHLCRLHNLYRIKGGDGSGLALENFSVLLTEAKKLTISWILQLTFTLLRFGRISCH